MESYNNNKKKSTAFSGKSVETIMVLIKNQDHQGGKQYWVTDAEVKFNSFMFIK